MQVAADAHMLKMGSRSSGMRLPPLVLVLGIHAAILWGLVHHATTITPPTIEPRSVVVSLINESTVAAKPVMPAAPKVTTHQPIKPKTESVQPKPEKQITPQLAPRTPIVSNTTTPSERAVEAVPVSPSPYSPKSMESTPSEVKVQPRFDADYLDNPKPTYPVLSRKLGEEGQVLLSVYVAADGHAEKVELSKSSGYSRLDKAAMDAVREWRFVPAKQGDRPVADWVTVPLDFKKSRLDN